MKRFFCVAMPFFCLLLFAQDPDPQQGDPPPDPEVDYTITVIATAGSHPNTNSTQNPGELNVIISPTILEPGVTNGGTILTSASGSGGGAIVGCGAQDAHFKLFNQEMKHEIDSTNHWEYGRWENEFFFNVRFKDVGSARVKKVYASYFLSNANDSPSRKNYYYVNPENILRVHIETHENISKFKLLKQQRIKLTAELECNMSGGASSTGQFTKTLTDTPMFMTTDYFHPERDRIIYPLSADGWEIKSYNIKKTKTACGIGTEVLYTSTENLSSEINFSANVSAEYITAQLGLKGTKNLTSGTTMKIPDCKTGSIVLLELSNRLLLNHYKYNFMGIELSSHATSSFEETWWDLRHQNLENCLPCD